MGVRAGQKSWQSYAGNAKRMVIAIDIGTTFSGASYCILNPGEKPKIIDVGSFPQQNAGHFKTSSTVLYGPDGNVMAIGNETNSDRVRHIAASIGASEARWWKLGLGSKNSFNENHDGAETYYDDEDEEEEEQARRHIHLPVGKTAEDVYTDYLAWIVDHVEKFIISHHQGGAQLVNETRASRLLVLTHPNGWEGAQQAAMRRACIRARAVADANRAATLVKFVSEAEASLTFALMCHTMSTWTEVGSQVAIVDAGGGTIDLTAYRIDSVTPYISVSEVCIPQCLFEGSVTVDNRAKALLKRKLQGTRWDNEEDLDAFMLDFVRTIKHSFASARQACTLKIGTNVDCDERIGLRKGILLFEGHEIAELFREAVLATVNGLRTIFADYPRRQPKRVAFVGGFSENVYFREEIAKALGHDVTVAKPDNATAKAVANGAVAWAIDGVVTARVAKMWYGVRVAIPLDRKKKSHVDRLHSKIESADGQTRLPDAFHVLCGKGSEVNAETDIKAAFSMTRSHDEDLKGSFDLIVYRGDDQPPEFIDDTAEGFETLCTLDVSLDRLQHALPVKNINGRRFRSARFEIHITLFETELTARWVWNEQAISHSGEAETVYLDDLEFFTRKASAAVKRPKRSVLTNDPEEAPENKQLPTAPGQQHRVEEDDDTNDDVSTISSLNNGPSGVDNLTSEQLSVLIRQLQFKQQQRQAPSGPASTMMGNIPSRDAQIQNGGPATYTGLAAPVSQHQRRPTSSSSSAASFDSVSQSPTMSATTSSRRRAPPPVPQRKALPIPTQQPVVMAAAVAVANVPSTSYQQQASYDQQTSAGMAKAREAASELANVGHSAPRIPDQQPPYAQQPPYTQPSPSYQQPDCGQQPPYAQPSPYEQQTSHDQAPPTAMASAGMAKAREAASELANLGHTATMARSSTVAQASVSAMMEPLLENDPNPPPPPPPYQYDFDMEAEAER